MSIRIATEQDLPQILSVYAPYVEQTTVSFEYEVPSPDAFRQRFLNITARFPWLVWEENSQILGYAYACAPFERAAYQWCAEPSIYLRQDVRGKGIGRKLYAALEEILRQQGFRLSYAIITSENDASLAFHSRMGYSHLAFFPDCAWKHGRLLGITWMQKQLNSAEITMNPPVPFPDFVQKSENLQNILAKMSLS